MKSKLSIQSLVQYFTTQVHAPFSIRLFSKLVYVWLLGNAAHLFMYHHLLWGPTKVFYRHGLANTPIENFFYQLVYDSHRFWPIYLLHLAACIVSLWEKNWTFIPRLVAWLTGMLLFYAAIPAFDGGILLMLLMSLYCCVVYTTSTNSYRIALTNAARIACIVQVMIVYLTASLYKLGGTHWRTGEALFYTLNIDHYSHPIWIYIQEDWSRFTYPLTWLGLVYQVLFPILIWIKKIRRPLLFIGIAFHFFIAAVIGLWGFSVAMIICYALFWDSEKKVRIGAVESKRV